MQPLHIHDINISLGNGIGIQPKQILRNISLHLQKGEVYGLIGPNGAGKTTLIQAIMGLLPIASGECTLFGKSNKDKTVQSRIGYLPDHTPFYDHLTGWENIRLFAQLRQVNSFQKKADPLIEKFLLNDNINDLVRNYSMGMKKRLGLIYSLLHDPELLLRDEPASGVDPHGRIILKDLIRTLQQEGKTILFSTHVLADVEEIADTCGILQQGTLSHTIDMKNHQGSLETYFIENIAQKDL